MQLLVSVRSAAEVESAVSGGADVVDAKEPRNGSLGAVSMATLTAIMRSVPETVPLSIALGDVSHRAEVAQAVAAIPPEGAVRRVTSSWASPASPDLDRFWRRSMRAARLPAAIRRVWV